LSARVSQVIGACDFLVLPLATIIRHIDALEVRLGVNLFRRLARGYAATVSGEDLFRLAQATDDQFSQLVGRIKGRGTDVSGELVVTSLVSLAPSMAPLLTAFKKEHPEGIVRLPDRVNVCFGLKTVKPMWLSARAMRRINPTMWCNLLSASAWGFTQAVAMLRNTACRQASRTTANIGLGATTTMTAVRRSTAGCAKK